jgi:hypothetical protein
VLALGFYCFPLSTVIYVSKDANMAAEFEEKRGLVLVTSVRCGKGPPWNIDEGCNT